jgi:hypothetical protein
MAEKAHMSTKATKRLVREGDFVAEVDVHLIEAGGGWGTGAQLTVSRDPSAYRFGDLVTWMLPGNLSHIGIVASDRYSCAVTGGVKPNITFDWTAGSHSLAAASQRKR